MRPVRFKLLRFGWLIALNCCLLSFPCVTEVKGQEPDATFVAVEPDAAPGTVPGAVPVTDSEILQRLQRTESELERLKAAREVDYGRLSAIQERFSQAKDPSITTVDEQTHQSPEKKAESKSKKWYDRLSLRGYAQFRFNTPLFEEGGSAPVQHVGDRSVGDDQNFLIRRARLIISGDVSDHLYVYLQPDFASTPNGTTDAVQFAQIRDWYGDLYIDEEKVHRVRIGQSKVPFGWENLQSSSNRLALDRSDSINSAVRNERDLGIFYYWTPEDAQDLFKYVLDEGLKGSGNYGVFAFGVHNGQGGSLAEQNDNVHLVTRLTYPFQIFNEQVVEVGIQAYTGQYSVLSAPIRPLGIGAATRPLGTIETDNREGILDERVGGTFIWYPQPFGFQAEWNVGNGPGLNDAQTEVVERSLTGGYGMVYYRHVTENCGILFPFAKYNFFKGGYKPERNAPYSNIHECEFGLEWQFNPQMELVTQYTITDRTNTVAQATGESYRQYAGHLLRMQFQINY